MGINDLHYFDSEIKDCRIDNIWHKSRAHDLKDSKKSRLNHLSERRKENSLRIDYLFRFSSCIWVYRICCEQHSKQIHVTFKFWYYMWHFSYMFLDYSVFNLEVSQVWVWKNKKSIIHFLLNNVSTNVWKVYSSLCYNSIIFAFRIKGFLWCWLQNTFAFSKLSFQISNGFFSKRSFMVKSCCRLEYYLYEKYKRYPSRN